MWSFPAVYAPAKSWLAVSVARSRRAWRLAMLDGIMAAGFDALNPVQWSAGSATYQQWKDKARGRLTLWGGGVNTQTTLPFGTVADVQREVRQVVPCLAADSGYIFCAIHNILAEVPPEKVLALYRTAKTAKQR